MLHKRHKHDIIVILAVIGFGVSLYLAFAKIMGATVPCDITGGCETVLNSKYSEMLGIPLSIWGTAFFSGIVIAALLANHYKMWRKILTYGLGFGSLFSLGFLFIQFFVLKQVCQYCLVTDLLTIIMFVWDLNIDKGVFGLQEN